MPKTLVGVNDPKAVKRFSNVLQVDTAKKGYWTKKFMGRGASTTMPIQELSHLENDSGDLITYDLSVQISMQPIEGDDTLEGKEEALKFYTDEVRIDQMRGGVNAGGKMSRKRSLHDMRSISRAREGDWWSRVFDELFFMYLSGTRGNNTGFVYPTDYAGFAANPMTAPDPDHQIYAGAATSKANITASDKFTTNVIDRAVARATMMGGGTEETPQIQPIMIDGEEHYCIVMSPWQAYDLRQDTGPAGWLEINKASASAEGRKSNIFKGALGLHNGVVLHQHKSSIRFGDYGVGANLPAGRALFLGAQAAVCAFGSAGTGLRYDWFEETADRGNQLIVTTGTIVGIKKTTYGPVGAKKDFGVMAIDTAAADPG